MRRCCCKSWRMRIACWTAAAFPQLRRRPSPLCRPAQAGSARRYKTRLTAPTPRPKPQASEPGHPTRQAPRAPLRVATGPQTSAYLTIADSNASTRAAIKTPIASQQQAWDHLDCSSRACAGLTAGLCPWAHLAAGDGTDVSCHLTGDSLESVRDRIVPSSWPEGAVRGQDGAARGGGACREGVRHSGGARHVPGAGGHEPAGLPPAPACGRRERHWAVSVSGNWRVTFRFEDGSAVDVDYVDYH